MDNKQFKAVRAIENGAFLYFDGYNVFNAATGELVGIITDKPSLKIRVISYIKRLRYYWKEMG